MIVGKNSDDPRLRDGFKNAVARDLQRLRQGRSAVADLCQRPNRYPVLSEVLEFLRPGWRHQDVIARQHQAATFFNVVIDDFSEARLAAALKAWIGLSGQAFSELDTRRAAAQKLWDPNGSSLPDTIYRTYERPIWGPALIEAVASPVDVDLDMVHRADASDLAIEDWEDDLDATHLAVVRNDPLRVAFLEVRLRGYIDAAPQNSMSTHLRARTYRLLADSRRDSGRLVGPDGASALYKTALDLESELGNERRQAEMCLMIAVVLELRENNERANTLYRRLVLDERLRPLQRAKAQLWVATTDTKLGNAQSAIKMAQQAVNQMNDFGSPVDVSNAEQKLALALKAGGEVEKAIALITRLEHPTLDPTPIETVRLEVARSDILSAAGVLDSDQLKRLEQVAVTATSRQMTTQLRYIRRVFNRLEGN